MKIIEHIGEYFLLMGRVFHLPDRWRMFRRQLVLELDKQGLQSILITLIVSVFMGAIMTMQTKLNTSNPLLPIYTTGLVTRDCILLEFSSTILCLLLAGKVGSNIASEIGTMRITEQIDAMEIMGVNHGHDAVAGYAVYGYRSARRIYHQLGNRYYDGQRVLNRYSVCLRSVLCVVLLHQNNRVCLRYCKHVELLWLLCLRRCLRSRSRKYQSCGELQHSDIALGCSTDQFDAELG